MKWFFVFFALALAPPLLGQTVNLRSADHDGFTRIVFDTASPQTAKVAAKGRTLEVKLPNATRDIGADGFFNRISRNRILDITVDRQAKAVRFSLACPCDHNSFVIGDRMLVLDIRDVESKPGVPADLMPTTQVWPRRKTAPALNLPARYGTTDARTDASVRTTLSFEKPKPNSLQSYEMMSLAVPEPKRRASQTMLEARLLSSLELADENVLSSRNYADKDGAQAAVGEMGEQMAFRSLAENQQRALPALERALNSTQSSCREFKNLNPQYWPEAVAAIDLIGARRRSLVAASEDVSDQSYRDLASAYLALAMGAEAAQILRAVKGATSEDEALDVLADVIDGLEPVETLAGTLPFCADTLVWHLMAGTPLSDKELGTAQLQFDTWPTGVRGVFAARFANALAKLDQNDAASMVLRRAQGAPELRSGERNLVKAQLAEADRDEASARKLRQEVIDLDLEASPEAAIAIARSSPAERRAVPESVANALESYSAERKGTEIEAELIRARITTAALAANFETAFGLMPEYTAKVRPSQSDLVLDEIIEAILVLQSDAAFLREAISIPDAQFARTGQELKDALTARIRELGFDDLADQLGGRQNTTDTAFESAAAPLGEDGNEASGIGLAGAGNSRIGEDTQARAREGASARVQIANRSAQALDNGTQTDARSVVADVIEDTAQPALPSAIAATQAVLEDVASLKAELAELGLVLDP